MKRNLTGARILLTGASSGIGRALACALARSGAKLIVTARREEALSHLAEELIQNDHAEVTVTVGDVTHPTTRETLEKTVREKFGGLDILINNAGVGATLRAEATSEETARRLFEVNYFAPFLLTQTFLPFLRESAKDPENQRRGIHPMVVNIGSIVGLRGTPHYGVYGSTKAALITLADAQRAESARDGIDFLTVSPGTTASEFFDVLLENRSMPNFPRHKKVSTEEVAVKIVKAMKKGKHRIIPHGESRVLDRIHRWSPSLADRIMALFC